MSSESEGGTRGGSLEDVRVDNVEIDDPLQYNLGQLKRRWKAFGALLGMALTTYAAFYIEEAVTIDVTVFGVLTFGMLLYVLVMLRADLEF